MKRGVVMQRLFFILSIIGISFICISCGTKNSAKDEKITLDENFVLSNQEFAFQLLDEAKSEQQDGENIFLSPASISIALLLAANGAEGITEEEILKTLHLADYSIEEINETFQQIQQSLLNTQNADIKIANSIWVRDDLELKDSYKEAIENYYHAKATALDFTKQQAANEINKWVSQATNGLIEEMIEDIPSNIVAYLLNAIYFKAEWLEPFEESLTTERPFYLDEGTKVDHPMMFKDGDFLYLDEENFSAIKLPYEGKRFYATFVLPKDDRNNFYEQLNAENFTEWNKRMEEKPGAIYLPKFKFEYEIILNNVLKKMGMESAFDYADFSNMFVDQLDTRIDEVKHKAVVEVNEEGTEAAAATSIAVKEMALPEQFYLEFNRPFFFMIYDSFTDTILFLGEVNNPKKN